jgi:hypothetical protein
MNTTVVFMNTNNHECLGLDYVVNFLTKKYPRLFVPVPEKPGYLHNCITDLTFMISKPYEMHPLEVAAQFVMEDLNILMQGAGDDPEQHYLWEISDIIGVEKNWHIGKESRVSQWRPPDGISKRESGGHCGRSMAQYLFGKKSFGSQSSGA